MLEIMWLECGKCYKGKPDDFILSTNKSYTIKKFIEIAYSVIGVKIIWKGKVLKK